MPKRFLIKKHKNVIIVSKERIKRLLLFLMTVEWESKPKVAVSDPINDNNNLTFRNHSNLVFFRRWH